MAALVLCAAASSTYAVARPALHSVVRAPLVPHARAALSMEVEESARPTASSLSPAPGVDLSKVYRRAEFWEEETCTLLDIVNVLGRWDKCSEWSERTEFSVVEAARVENMAQGASVERFEYAKRNGYVERVAMVQNVPKLPFKNAELAAWAGKTVEEMDAMAVNSVATSIVFDALAQSKSGLVPPAVL